MTDELNEERLHEIANALSGLTLSQWDYVKLAIDHLYHPVKKTLTSEEISVLLTKYRAFH